MARQRVRAFGLQQAMSEAGIAALATAVTEIAHDLGTGKPITTPEAVRCEYRPGGGPHALRATPR